MIRTAHTAELDQPTLAAARALLDAAFADDPLTPEDWEHCLGGIHALAYDGDALVGHAAVVQRRIVHAGHAWRVGYVEGVAVSAERRRQGIASALMGALEAVIRGGYDFGALGSSDDGLPFYTGRGWAPWRGTLRVLTLDGIEETPDELGFILVFGGELDLDGDLLCADVRPGEQW